MNNPQKLVFTMLAAILLLEFGSFTKLQTVWGLAFTGAAPTTGTPQSSSQSGQSPTQTVSTEPYHPTTGQTKQV